MAFAVGTFDTVTAATRRIREIEGCPDGGLFLEMFVEIDHGSDDDACSVLHYTGSHALHGIRRSRAN